MVVGIGGRRAGKVDQAIGSGEWHLKDKQLRVAGQANDAYNFAKDSDNHLSEGYGAAFTGVTPVGGDLVGFNRQSFDDGSTHDYGYYSTDTNGFDMGSLPMPTLLTDLVHGPVNLNPGL